MRTGDLMARLTNDLSAVRMAAGPAIMYFMNTIAGGTFALAFMLAISPRLTLVAALPMALLPALGLLLGRRIHARFESVQAHFSDLTTLAQENLAGVRIVRAFRQEQAEAARFGALNEGYLDKNMGLAQLYGLMQPAFSIFAGLGMVAVVGLGGALVLHGTITIGAFVAFGMYLGMLTWPLIALGWVINLFQRGAASMSRLLDILDAKPELAEPAQPRALPSGPVGTLDRVSECRISLSGVSRRQPRWVLRDMNLMIAAGSTIGVVGATASGKSALMDLVPRLFDPQEGEILIDGVPIRDTRTCRAPPRDRIRAARELSLQRHDRQQPRLRHRRRDGRTMGRRSRATQRDDRRSSRADLTLCWASEVSTCREGRSSARRWRVRWRVSRASCCSTTRFRRSTRTPRRRFSRSLRGTLCGADGTHRLAPGERDSRCDLDHRPRRRTDSRTGPAPRS